VNQPDHLVQKRSGTVLAAGHDLVPKKRKGGDPGHGAHRTPLVKGKVRLGRILDNPESVFPGRILTPPPNRGDGQSGAGVSPANQPLARRFGEHGVGLANVASESGRPDARPTFAGALPANPAEPHVRPARPAPSPQKLRRLQPLRAQAGRTGYPPDARAAKR